MASGGVRPNGAVGARRETLGASLPEPFPASSSQVSAASAVGNQSEACGPTCLPPVRDGKCRFAAYNRQCVCHWLRQYCATRAAWNGLKDFAGGVENGTADRGDCAGFEEDAGKRDWRTVSHTDRVYLPLMVDTSG